MTDYISRQAAIAIKFTEAINEDGVIYVSLREYLSGIKSLPSAQPEDWVERNKERILQAGMEGREVEFYIGGRLFAIREIAQ